MVKIIYLLALTTSFLYPSQSFENSCMTCHINREIPNEVIYKRYLLKYSSDRKIKEAIVKFLKNPASKDTIMPQQFITIFGLKERSKLSDSELNKLVAEFIKRYDIKKKLILPQNYYSDR